jgi:hypothetical protein
MIIPTKKVGAAGGFNDPVQIVRRPKLERLVRNVREFFLVYKTIDSILCPQNTFKRRSTLTAFRSWIY